MAGIPTYSLTAEASVAKLLRGELELVTAFPAELAVSGSRVWRLNRDFSLYHATMNARRQNPVVVVGQAARAVLEEAHARCCAAERWVLNEKHLIDRAELGDADPLLRHIASTDDMAVALVALRSFLHSNGEHG